MATQGIKVFITGMAGYLIIRYAEVATPTAYLGQTPARVFPVDYTYSITNLRRVAHYFEFWQSSDGVTLDQQIKKWEIDVSKQELPIIENYDYEVDGPKATDPVSEQLTLRDARLKDKSYVVFEQGTGHLVPGIDYIDRSEEGGGFDRSAGYEFQNGGRYLVIVQDRIVVDTPEAISSGGGGFSDIVIIGADSNTVPFDIAWLGKVVECNFNTTGNGVIQFPLFSTIPDGVIRFSTQLGNQTYARLQFSGSNTVSFHKDNRPRIFLGKSESIDLLFKGGVCYVINDNTNYNIVGQRVYGDCIELNTLLRDGSTHNLETAGRLIDWAVERFSAGQLLDFATWGSVIFGEDESGSAVSIAPNKRFFAWNNATQQLRLPDSRQMFQRALGATDGTQMPGLYQHDTAHFKRLYWTGEGNGGGNISTGIGYKGGSPGPEREFWIKQEIIGIETRPRSECLLPLIRI